MTRTTFPPSRYGVPWGRRQALLLPAALSGAVASPSVASAARAEAVDLLLVLAVDASGSIDADEFRLQREGCAGALVHPAVLAAVASQPLGAIGAALVEWGSPGGAATVVDWHRVDDATSAERLARAVLDAPRSPQSWNAIGDAVDHAAGLIAAAPWRATRKVIDVSGDGPDMRGLRPVEAARHDAADRGITVNALAIEGGRPGLGAAYEATVIAGEGAFVTTAHSRRLRPRLARQAGARDRLTRVTDGPSAVP